MIHAADGPIGDAAGGGAGGGWLRFLRGPPRQRPTTAQKKLPRRHSAPVVDDRSSASRNGRDEEKDRRQRPQAPRYRSLQSVPASIDAGPDLLAADGCDDGSVVSEVTLMTYSDEKAKLVKEEFFERLRRRDRDGSLSLEEKEALLREVQAEQETLFQRSRERERREVLQRRRLSTEEKKEFFQRLGAMRLRKEREESERRLSQPEEGYDEVLADLAGTAGQREGDSWGASPASLVLKGGGASAAPDDALDDLEGAFRTAGTLSRRRHDERNGSWTTAAPEDDAVRASGAAEEPEAATPRRADPEETQESMPPRRDAGPDQASPPPREAGAEGPPTSAADPPPAAAAPGRDEHIAEIVHLKLLAAEQQAEIDTLSSALHNLRVAGRRRQKSSEGGIGLWKELEKELPLAGPQDQDAEARNRDLAHRLELCREREAGLRRELNLRESHLDESDREREALEGRNRELERENEELRNMLKESQRQTKGVASGGGLLDHSHRSEGARSGRSRRSSVRSSATTQTTAALSSEGGSGAARTL